MFTKILIPLLFTLFCIPALHAADLDIAQDPLIIKAAVKPNLILAVDDSGSMDFETFFLNTSDADLWWYTKDRSFTGRDEKDQSVSKNVLNYNKGTSPNKNWKQYNYLFPIGEGLEKGRRKYGDGKHNHFVIPPFPQYAFARCAEYNRIYFDPTVTYEPWKKPDGTSYPDSDPSDAKTDPIWGSAAFHKDGEDETLDLAEVQKSKKKNMTFRVQEGMILSADITLASSGDWSTTTTESTATAEDDYGIAYFPATFYVAQGTKLPPEYDGYKDSAKLTGYAPNGTTVLDGYEIKKEHFKDTAALLQGEAYKKAIQNFANWFTYYRKRSLALRAAFTHSFAGISNMRVGSFFFQKRKNDVTMYDMADSTDKKSLFDTVLKHKAGGGTYTRQAVKFMGQQFDENEKIIQERCQQNFGMIFTDGFPNNHNPHVGGQDNDDGPPYADSIDNTMADIARYYYENGLRSGDFSNVDVPVENGCPASEPTPLDCNDDLHMVFSALMMGAKGTIYGTDPDATKAPYSHSIPWPSKFPDHDPRHVDDIWHATINAKGEMYNAHSPEELREGFDKALNAIAERTSSSSAVTTNTTRMDTETLVFQARFNNEDWSGEVLAYSIDENGSLTEVWNAANHIPGHASRNIFTYSSHNATIGTSPTPEGKEFTWSALPDSLKNLLDTDGNGAERVSYLRGDQSQEGGLFRERDSLLGDIVNSDPLYVGTQDYGYSSKTSKLTNPERTAYKDYRTGTLPDGVTKFEDRIPVIYIGANDGMLHAFEATQGESTSGDELFAYIPASIIPNLSKLSDTTYNANHRYFVDGSPRAVDAYIGAEFKTVLAGSTGAGGRSVFALDVTDPKNFDENGVLWEFTHKELGYTIGQPTIIRSHATNDQWRVIFGNGYNSDSHKAQLFLLDIEEPFSSSIQGTRIDTGEGTASDPNGLASPVPIDFNRDRITDVIYAGDLLGNLWRFDVSDSDPANWKKSLLFQAEDGTGNSQPITTRPTVGGRQGGSDEDVIVYFGTGKFFLEGDLSDTSTQTFYGIYDDGSGTTVTRSELQEQTIEMETSVCGFDYRITSDNSVNSTKGWYMDLNATGERVISPALLRDDRIIFTTMIPDDDKCSFGGDSWLMELDAQTGGRLAYSVFDVDGDGDFDRDDITALGGTAASGRKLKEGMAKAPAIIHAGSKELKLFSGTSGNLEIVEEKSGLSKSSGRKSWRQIQ